MMIDWKKPMRLFGPSARARAVPLHRPADEQRRAWIEVLFSDHLPAEPRQRQAAITALAADGDVWRTLQRTRRSTAEINAVIKRLAALAGAEPQAARAA